MVFERRLAKGGSWFVRRFPQTTATTELLSLGGEVYARSTKHECHRGERNVRGT